MNPYLYITQTRCRGETFVAITIVTCACSLGNKVNIKKQDPKVATKGNRLTRATSQGSKPLTFKKLLLLLLLIFVSVQKIVTAQIN